MRDLARTHLGSLQLFLDPLGELYALVARSSATQLVLSALVSSPLKLWAITAQPPSQNLKTGHVTYVTPL